MSERPRNRFSYSIVFDRETFTFSLFDTSDGDYELVKDGMATFQDAIDERNAHQDCRIYHDSLEEEGSWR